MQVWWNPLQKFNLFIKEEKPEFFLMLILGKKEVRALLVKKLAGKVEILGRGEESFSNLIEEIEVEELVEATDRAISRAEENLPSNLFTTKTILTVKDDWVEEGKIKKEYFSILKRLKDDLELEFLGFVVITEAICHLLQKEEGVPSTLILVNKEAEILTVALIRAGRIAELAIRRVEDKNFSQNLERILRGFKNYEILPSRISLSGEGDLEELRQELLSFPWTKILPFLHFPKIEVLEKDFQERAIITGFATEMGVKFETQPAKTQAEEAKTEAEPEAFGFVKERDVLDLPTSPKINLSWIRLPRIQLPKNLPRLSNIRLPTPKLPEQRKLFYLFLVPLIMVAIVLAYYFFFIQAKVTVFVKSKIVEIGSEVVIDPKIEKADPTQKRIKGNLVETELSDSLEGQVTGKKETGEKAKGEVTIYNKSIQSQTMASGITITGPNSLKFTLDEKVIVASASGATDPSLPTIPSKINVKVTAAKIGEESNLPSGTAFSIGTLVDVAAKNDDAFSGGSKKEVTVVSKKDQDNLTKALLNKLTELAKEEVLKSDKNREDLKIVDAALTQEIIERKFSKKIDEEANNLSLFLKVKFKTLSFNESELQNLFEDKIKEASGEDFVIKPGGVNISFVETKLNRDKSVSSKVNVRATLFPKIDQKSLKNKIKSKKPETAFKILETIPNIADYKIKISPILPLLPGLLPPRAENIKIEVQEK